MTEDPSQKSATFPAALSSCEVHMRVLLEGLADAVVMVDERGIVHAAGAGVSDLFGYDPREIVGGDIGLLFSYSDRERVKLELFQDGDIPGSHEVRLELRALKRNGDGFHAELYLRRIELACDRSSVHFVGTVHDLSGKRAAEAALAESERRLRALFNQEFQFIGLMKPDGTLIEVNQPVLDLAGTTRAEQLNRPLWETVWWSHSPELQSQVRAWTELAAAGEFVREEVNIMGAGGKLATVDFSIKPMRDDDGEIELLIPEGRDVTELVHARRRETAMLEALAEIGESASILAHEVKNPITALNLALRAVADSMGADERALVEELVTRMQRLERQIRRTLSFTKPLEIELAECDLVVLADSILAELRVEFRAAGVPLDVDFPDEDTTVLADEHLIGEVIMNLLRNALEAIVREDGAAAAEAKPSHRKPLVRLSVHAAGPTSMLELAVGDSGPGIPSEVVSDLFRPFHTTKAQGTGLGLALCRKIVREHGGSIEVGASRYGGARFVIKLPRYADQP
jgi:PAS domain S-box-containing protein